MLLRTAGILPRAAPVTYVPIAQSAVADWRFRSSAVTHAGVVRAHNEDSYVDRPDLGLWAVADGAGGHQAGDIASRIITGTLGSPRPSWCCWRGTTTLPVCGPATRGPTCCAADGFAN